MAFMIALAVSSALFFYLQAWKHAMSPKRWGLMGLLMGPFLYPMFRTHKRLKLLKAVGRQSVLFCA